MQRAGGETGWDRQAAEQTKYIESQFNRKGSPAEQGQLLQHSTQVSELVQLRRTLPHS